MIAIPAVDLRDGACVQLVGGDYEAEKVRLPDPVAVARKWAEHGFERLHVVDLDAATGRGSNREVIQRIIRAFPGSVQVGGSVGIFPNIPPFVEQLAASIVKAVFVLEPHLAG